MEWLHFQLVILWILSGLEYRRKVILQYTKEPPTVAPKPLVVRESEVSIKGSYLLWLDLHQQQQFHILSIQMQADTLSQSLYGLIGLMPS